MCESSLKFLYSNPYKVRGRIVWKVPRDNMCLIYYLGEWTVDFRGVISELDVKIVVEDGSGDFEVDVSG